VKIVEGVIAGGTIRRASPAMVDSYHEYVAEDYYRVRAVAQTDLVLVHVVGVTAGQALGTHGARQMIERARASRRVGSGQASRVPSHVGYRVDRGHGREHQGGGRRGRPGELTDGRGDLCPPRRRSSARGGACDDLGREPVSGAPYRIASVEDLFALDPLARFAALIAGPNFDGYLRAEPIRFDPAHPIYGTSCRVPGCAMHSTQAEWWCTRHGQSRRDALRAGLARRSGWRLRSRSVPSRPAVRWGCGSRRAVSVPSAMRLPAICAASTRCS